MTAQSVAGLSAKAVNEGRSNEMVWIANGDPDLERWHARLLTRNPNLKVEHVANIWELVDRYVARGIIRGYILYTSDASKGE